MNNAGYLSSCKVNVFHGYLGAALPLHGKIPIIRIPMCGRSSPERSPAKMSVVMPVFIQNPGK